MDTAGGVLRSGDGGVGHIRDTVAIGKDACAACGIGGDGTVGDDQCSVCHQSCSTHAVKAGAVAAGAVVRLAGDGHIIQLSGHALCGKQNGIFIGAGGGQLAVGNLGILGIFTGSIITVRRRGLASHTTAHTATAGPAAGEGDRCGNTIVAHFHGYRIALGNILIAQGGLRHVCGGRAFRHFRRSLPGSCSVLWHSGRFFPSGNGAIRDIRGVRLAGGCAVWCSRRSFAIAHCTVRCVRRSFAVGSRATGSLTAHAGLSLLKYGVRGKGNDHRTGIFCGQGNFIGTDGVDRAGKGLFCKADRDTLFAFAFAAGGCGKQKCTGGNHCK